MERNITGSGTGGLRCGDVEIHYDRILAAANDDGFAWLILFCIELLVRHIRRHVNEIARSRLFAEFKVVAPAHSGASFDDVKHCFQLAVMMRSGFRAWLDHDRARPQFGCAGAGMSDGCRSGHTRSLRRVEVEFS